MIDGKGASLHGVSKGQGKDAMPCRLAEVGQHVHDVGATCSDLVLLSAIAAQRCR